MLEACGSLDHWKFNDFPRKRTLRLNKNLSNTSVHEFAVIMLFVTTNCYSTSRDASHPLVPSLIPTPDLLFVIIPTDSRLKSAST